MYGQNPKRAAIFNDGTTLEIKNIFRTIQGEGPFVGMPAVFVRLVDVILLVIFAILNLKILIY